VNRTLGLAALLLLAILAIVGVVGVTRPVRVETATQTPQATATASPIENDAGSLDSMLDGLHVEHLMKHGR
jgi:hypothetical protein